MTKARNNDYATRKCGFRDPPACSGHGHTCSCYPEVEKAISPKSVLAKCRGRVRLELKGRPYLEGTPLGGEQRVSFYMHAKGGAGPRTDSIAFGDIEAIWDLSLGKQVWRKSDTTK